MAHTYNKLSCNRVCVCVCVYADLEKGSMIYCQGKHISKLYYL